MANLAFRRHPRACPEDLQRSDKQGLQMLGTGPSMTDELLAGLSNPNMQNPRA